MKVLDLSTYPSSEQVIFETAIAKMKAKFHYSRNNENINKIEITSWTTNKEIYDVTYCDKTDAIEIHYFRNTKNPFKTKTYALTNCKLNVIRILVLDYASNEKPQSCESANGNATIPGTSKGNIIVGNP